MGLTNYILTCEKDNERLKYELSYYKGYSKRLKEKNIKYKEVIDKAIEYIEKHLNAKSYGNHKYELFDREYLEEVLEILNNKGDKK